MFLFLKVIPLLIVISLMVVISLLMVNSFEIELLCEIELFSECLGKGGLLGEGDLLGEGELLCEGGHLDKCGLLCDLRSDDYDSTVVIIILGLCFTMGSLNDVQSCIFIIFFSSLHRVLSLFLFLVLFNG